MERRLQSLQRIRPRRIRGGYVYTASFDLTACYDSLDHRVLRHFLDKLGLDPDFCISCRGGWRSGPRPSGHHHGHGIPQGPFRPASSPKSCLSISTS